MAEGREVQTTLEGGVHRSGRRIELGHGRKTQQQFHAAEHGTGGVQGAVDHTAPAVRAQNKTNGATGIDVVGTILCIVLDDEDRRLFPVRAVADTIDQLADRPVVVGHSRHRRGCAHPGALRVVFAQAHHHKVW